MANSAEMHFQNTWPADLLAAVGEEEHPHQRLARTDSPSTDEPSTEVVYRSIQHLLLQPQQLLPRFAAGAAAVVLPVVAAGAERVRSVAAAPNYPTPDPVVAAAGVKGQPPEAVAVALARPAAAPEKEPGFAWQHWIVQARAMVLPPYETLLRSVEVAAAATAAVAVVVAVVFPRVALRHHYHHLRHLHWQCRCEPAWVQSVTNDGKPTKR